MPSIVAEAAKDKARREGGILERRGEANQNALQMLLSGMAPGRGVLSEFDKRPKMRGREK